MYSLQLQLIQMSPSSLTFHHPNNGEKGFPFLLKEMWSCGCIVSKLATKLINSYGQLYMFLQCIQWQQTKTFYQNDDQPYHSFTWITKESKLFSEPSKS